MAARPSGRTHPPRMRRVGLRAFPPCPVLDVQVEGAACECDERGGAGRSRCDEVADLLGALTSTAEPTG